MKSYQEEINFDVYYAKVKRIKRMKKLNKIL